MLDGWSGGQARWVGAVGRRGRRGLDAQKKAPAEAGAGIETHKWLELKDGCKLDTARPAASEEWVADAYVAGSRERIVTAVLAGQIVR